MISVTDLRALKRRLAREGPKRAASEVDHKYVLVITVVLIYSGCTYIDLAVTGPKVESCPLATRTSVHTRRYWRVK